MTRPPPESTLTYTHFPDTTLFRSKVLGATRTDLLRAFLIEYGILGLVTAAIAAAIGTLTAWAVLVWVMDVDWVFLPSAVAVTILLSTAVTVAFGFAGTWRALGHKAAPLLRKDRKSVV